MQMRHPIVFATLYYIADFRELVGLCYGVATISRLLQNIGLFCRI